MNILSSHHIDSPQRLARKSFTLMLIVLGLIALVMIDQSVHWIVSQMTGEFDLSGEPPAHPGLWVAYSLFFASTAGFGYTILYKRSQSIGRLHQAALLVTAWAIAATSLSVIAWSLPLAQPEISIFLDAEALTPLEAILFTLDQTARGAFFDTIEALALTWSPAQPNPDVWWFALTLVIYRAMTSVLSVVALVRLLGLSSESTSLDALKD